MPEICSGKERVSRDYRAGRMPKSNDSRDYRGLG
jgi:hypothetical protein